MACTENNILIFSPSHSGTGSFIDVLCNKPFNSTMDSWDQIITLWEPLPGQKINIKAQKLNNNTINDINKLIPTTTHIMITAAPNSTTTDINCIHNLLKYLQQQLPQSVKRYCILLQCDLEASLSSKHFHQLSQTYGFEYFECSAQTGQDIKRIQFQLIESVLPINQPSNPLNANNNNTASTMLHLHIESESVNIAMIDFLLSTPSQKNSIGRVDSGGYTPLLLACLNNNYTVVKHLITQYSANYRQKNDKTNQNILQIASTTNNTNLIGYLMSLDVQDLLADCDDDTQSILLHHTNSYLSQQMGKSLHILSHQKNPPPESLDTLSMNMIEISQRLHERIDTMDQAILSDPVKLLEYVMSNE